MDSFSSESCPAFFTDSIPFVDMSMTMFPFSLPNPKLRDGQPGNHRKWTCIAWKQFAVSLPEEIPCWIRPRTRPDGQKLL